VYFTCCCLTSKDTYFSFVSNSYSVLHSVALWLNAQATLWLTRHRICNAFRYKIRIYEAIVLVGNRVKVCVLVLAHAFVNTPAQHITRVIENCVAIPAFVPVFDTDTVLFLVHFTSIWYLNCYKIGTAPSLRGMPSDCV